MNMNNYATMLESKLIEEFKTKFFKKLGYEPIVQTTSSLKTTNDEFVKAVTLPKLKEYFIPFLPTYRGAVLQLDVICRKIEIVELRVMFSFIAKNMGYTLKSIGNILGNRDHCTIIHHLRNFKNWVEVDFAFRDNYNAILNHIVTIQNKNNESSTLEHTDQMEHQS